MSIKMEQTLLALFVLALVMLAAGCQEKRALPEKPPEVHAIEFTGPEAGWPPKPKGQTNVTEVAWQEIPGSLTDSLEAAIRRAALQDTRVPNLLGARFAYISTDEIEPAEKRSRLPSEPLVTRVTFFSHSNNVAVEARLQGLRVDSAKTKEGYQPPEGKDEIEAAIALARRDDRLRDKVPNLSGDAILAFPEREQPGYGHRVLYVTFSIEEEDLPRYFALVDLTEPTVLSAGPITGR